MLISGIALTAVQYSKTLILNSTIEYEVTEESPDNSMLSFDIDEETSATVVVILTQAEGEYTIRIDGDTGSNIINAPIPQGDLRMITYNVTLKPDHYTVTAVAEDNAIGEHPNLQVTIK